MRMVVEATKEMIFCAQKSSGWCIVDARSSDAYIGWKKEGEIGGHIPYSRLFSAEWLEPRWRKSNAAYEACLELQLESQTITPEKHIIIYDENGEDAEKVCDYFISKGITSLFYLNLKNWDGDLSKYPNHRLMAPLWLVKEMIDGNAGKYGISPEFKIFEISWKEPSQEYLEAHIPGAVHIDSNEFEVPPKWIMAEDEALIDFAKKNGITPDTTVVAYGNTILNAAAAAKLATVLRYIGVKNVMCLNGTIQNWILAGYPTEKGNIPKSPCECENEKFVFERSHALHMEGAKELLADPGKGTVVDIRSWECYIGKTSGYPYLDKAGRIPGAVWSYYPNEFMTPINQIGNLDVMMNVLETAGIDMKKTTAFFCGSASWGAAIYKTFANVAGYDKATIYEGGWCEWCAYPENPFETGIPEKYKDYDPEHFRVSELMSGEGCHVM